MSRAFFPVGALVALLLVPESALAHIEITSHTTRFDASELKDAPCGSLGSPVPTQIYEVTRGSEFTIAWDEYIDHPGHYRISFDPSGNDAFVDPATADDLYPSPTVLLDDIADVPDAVQYQATVTLPDVTCEACSLQLIQVMTDKPPFGDGDDLYYQCIDLRLIDGVPTGSGGSSGVGGSPPASGGTAASSGGSLGTDGSGGAAQGGGGNAATAGCSWAAPRGSASWGLVGFALALLSRRRQFRRLLRR